MKELVVPVPETVTAAYVVPVPAPMSTVEAGGNAIGHAAAAGGTGPSLPGRQPLILAFPPSLIR